MRLRNEIVSHAPPAYSHESSNRKTSDSGLDCGSYNVIFSSTSCLLRDTCPMFSDRIRCVHSKHLYRETEHNVLSGHVTEISTCIRPFSIMSISISSVCDASFQGLLFSFLVVLNLACWLHSCRRRSRQLFASTASEEMRISSVRTFQCLLRAATNHMQLIY